MRRGATTSWTGRIGAIGAATLTASLLGFILLGLVARILPPDQNAAFLSIWGLIFAFGSVIAATEQEIARQATIASMGGRKVPGSVGQVAASALVLSAIGVLTFSVTPAGRTIFADSVWIVVLAVICVSGLSVQFLARGVYLGTGRTATYVAVIVLESLLRAGLAAVLLLTADRVSLVVPVAAIAIGCFAWVPTVVGLVRAVDWVQHQERWARVAQRMGPLALANGLSAVVLTAFPSLVTVMLGTSQGLATLFGVVTLTRVPIVLLTPLQALTVPAATRLVEQGRSRELSRLQLGLGVGATLLAAVVGLSGYVLGPWGMRVFMGPQYDASGTMVAILLLSSVFIAAALLQAAVCVALQRYGLVLGTWAIAVAVAVAVLGLADGGNESRAMWSFVGASFAAYGASALLLRRAIRRRVDETDDASAAS